MENHLEHNNDRMVAQPKAAHIIISPKAGGESAKATEIAKHNVKSVNVIILSALQPIRTLVDCFYSVRPM